MLQCLNEDNNKLCRSSIFLAFFLPFFPFLTSSAVPRYLRKNVCLPALLLVPVNLSHEPSPGIRGGGAHLMLCEGVTKSQRSVVSPAGGSWLRWGSWNALIEFWYLLRFYPVACVAICSFISQSCDCGRCSISSTSANISLPLSLLKNVTMWRSNKTLSLLNITFFLSWYFFQCLGLGALFKISEQHKHAGFMYWFCKWGTWVP